MPRKKDISNDRRIENVAAHQYGKAIAKRFEVHHSLIKDYSQVENISYNKFTQGHILHDKNDKTPES